MEKIISLSLALKDFGVTECTLTVDIMSAIEFQNTIFNSIADKSITYAGEAIDETYRIKINGILINIKTIEDEH